MKGGQVMSQRSDCHMSLLSSKESPGAQESELIGLLGCSELMYVLTGAWNIPNSLLA